ncbi:MAG: DUF1016 N-terminal domain-containing protein, partial [Betaproteobacteria bacterium]
MMAKRKVRAKGTPPIFDRIREIVEAAQANVARTVNTTQVVANWLIGREIVEEEQQGKKRADYGDRVVAQLSSALTAAYGNGWSAQNLSYMRQFYLGYPGLMSGAAIHHALRGELPATPIFHAARGKSETTALAGADAGQP